MLTSDFQYELPASAIAQVPLEERDAARLLVTSSMVDAAVRDLPTLLESGDLLIVNRTRVRPARLVGHKPATGGRVELLLTRRVDRARWEALIRPARRIGAGTLLDFGPIVGEVLDPPIDGVVVVRLEAAEGDVEDVLGMVGQLPLPPYFRGQLANPDRYQTMFAKTTASTAAPTAGLHFTPALVEGLQARSVGIAEVDLEIGLDTFRPISSQRVEDHRIHRERYSIPEPTAAAIATTKSAGGRVVAVGTTVVRTLETAADDGGVVAGEGESALFITPGYRLRVVDAVLTNFHAPGTTLILLVAALLGPRWRSVYETALARGYRFLSFGDAMLIDGPVNRG